MVFCSLLFHPEYDLHYNTSKHSDVNKDWTCKDKDKDEAYKDKDKDYDPHYNTSRELIMHTPFYKQKLELEGCIDDERQFKAAKHSQAPGDATVRKRFSAITSLFFVVDQKE